MAGRKHSGKFREQRELIGENFRGVRKVWYKESVRETDAAETGAAPAVSFCRIRETAEGTNQGLFYAFLSENTWAGLCGSGAFFSGQRNRRQPQKSGILPPCTNLIFAI